ncbi:hypothetical protein GLOIN_2v1789022 [Rhizophagus irregularis DAOM 181602=DAOM 197198]|uniref:Uncharacterized protein n=1 Tax=Rhizophagus irregularis (strain DAOM 181602 / DAOM 197198 / MUCL 43194) TaxID=747089 RepID=A0A2P4P2B3_RHIID|nr:hypothetical protein GLOIN_2v1789022 [Rhizophagus irregularis DAOM 181602=DAOM 197198]POG59530.1 hypothetical protein GLOIN_2v1789022 [Rhizophagus irregularis DAOM 181602=DAOM 197198]|eukprot:XP_025166396.1 hypothetical protein GLOIN_2v1789022 [Rhizophagus irregularis DAOM 181602=DAOM 197198]
MRHVRKLTKEAEHREKLFIKRRLYKQGKPDTSKVSRYDLIGQNGFYEKTEFRKASNNVASSSSSEDEQFFEASDSQSGSRIPSIEELENCNKLNATFSERINKLNEGTAPTKGIEKGVELEK